MCYTLQARGQACKQSARFSSAVAVLGRAHVLYWHFFEHAKQSIVAERNLHFAPGAMASSKSDDLEEAVKLELPSDDQTSVLLLSGGVELSLSLSLSRRFSRVQTDRGNSWSEPGAWAAAFAIFASNVATLTLAVSETAPAVELETLPLGLALLMQGGLRMSQVTRPDFAGPAVRRGNSGTSRKGALLGAQVHAPRQKLAAVLFCRSCFLPRYLAGAGIGVLSCGALALGCWLLDFSLQCLGAALMGGAARCISCLEVPTLQLHVLYACQGTALRMRRTTASAPSRPCPPIHHGPSARCSLGAYLERLGILIFRQHRDDFARFWPWLPCSEALLGPGAISQARDLPLVCMLKESQC